MLGLRPGDVLRMGTLERKLAMTIAGSLEEDRREFQADLTEALAEVFAEAFS